MKKMCTEGGIKMKKKLLAVTCMALASTFSFAACNLGGGLPGGDSVSDSTGTGNKKTIVEALDIEVLVFEDTIKGWEALAAEYQRLHGNAVVVNLNSTYTEASSYTQNLNNQVTNKDGEWDIVQGNLFTGGSLQTYGVDMNTAVIGENAYAGAVDGEARIWKEVLTEDAYLTDKSGANTSTYIMNSEGLQTAWFVNDVARDAAVQAGYTGSETPANWGELSALRLIRTRSAHRSSRGCSVYTVTTTIEANIRTSCFRIATNMTVRTSTPNRIWNTA